jgi:hypothetical protein
MLFLTFFLLTFFLFLHLGCVLSLSIADSIPRGFFVADDWVLLFSFSFIVQMQGSDNKTLIL